MNALLLITIAILVLAIINLWLSQRKKTNNPSALNYSHQPAQKHSVNDRLSSDVIALNAGSIGLGERLLRIERNQKLLTQRLEQVELQDKTNSGYQQAIKLIKQGINKNDLISACGLSEAEAGLLMMMNQKQQKKTAIRH